MLSLLPAMIGVSALYTVRVQPAEMAEARRWVAAEFEGNQAKPASLTGLTVLANNDPVQKNAQWGTVTYLLTCLAVGGRM